MANSESETQRNFQVAMLLLNGFLFIVGVGSMVMLYDSVSRGFAGIAVGASLVGVLNAAENISR
jgi:hypothetical protein